MGTTQANSPAIELRKVSKSYDQRIVWKDLDLVFHLGQIYVLHGQNGCGKTTLLRLLAGLTLADQGEIFLLANPASIGDQRAQDLVSLYQPSQRGLWPSLRVGDNWRLQATVQKANSTECAQTLQELREFSGALSELWPHQLSTGFRQIALITKTLIKTCPIYLLDEPFANLDNLNSLRLKSILQKQSRQGACVVITAQSADIDQLNDLGQILNLEEKLRCI